MDPEERITHTGKVARSNRWATEKREAAQLERYEAEATRAAADVEAQEPAPETHPCIECGRPVIWDDQCGDYRHTDARVPYCTLALEEPTRPASFAVDLPERSPADTDGTT